ncbi:glycoside hydrolase superfamily [Lipomyces japonicus]|uniref:glycoside hydrolase superfamily n=1 Tax=Lipomyces japonicus TaxID=56871 RepID=UPI0034CFDD6F
MRFVSTAFFLATAVSCVSAIGDLGFSLGVKRNSDGGCKTTEDYLADFNTIGAYSNIVRVYAASDCNTLQYILPAVKQAGVQLVVGVWPTDDTHFSEEKQALTTYLPGYASNVYAVTVGSEALYRGDLTAEQLASDIDEIRTLVQGIDGYGSTPVGTADSWNVLVNAGNYAAIQASDVVLANAFSYWQGQTMANSSHSFVDDIMQALQIIQTVKGSTDISFWVGETGWPTDGGNYGASVPSVANAAQFWQESICGIRAWGINTFVFEAFDESWKPVTSGVSGVETHWGVWTDSNQSPKYSIDCDF